MEHSTDVSASAPTIQMPMAELPEGWEAARQFHRLKRLLPRPVRREIAERAVAAIVARAQDLLRHATRPSRGVQDAFPAAGDLDLDRTLAQPRPWRPSDIAVHRVEPREVDVALILDMSLSMTGEKIALTALSAAILRLKLESVAVISFDTKAHLLVATGERVTVRTLVRRILEVPAQGYTNIEAGLRMGTEQLRNARRRERVGILMTDGIANIGGDPVAMAGRFPALHVVQVGAEEAQGGRCCRKMSVAGRGRLYRAPTYAVLPEVMRQLVRECFRA